MLDIKGTHATLHVYHTEDVCPWRQTQILKTQIPYLCREHWTLTYTQWTRRPLTRGRGASWWRTRACGGSPSPPASSTSRPGHREAIQFLGKIHMLDQLWYGNLFILKLKISSLFFSAAVILTCCQILVATFVAVTICLDCIHAFWRAWDDIKIPGPQWDTWYQIQNLMGHLLHSDLACSCSKLSFFWMVHDYCYTCLVRWERHHYQVS